MRLVDEWRVVLRKAWSVRLLIVSTALGSVSIALMITGADWLGWPPAAVLTLIVVTNVAAIIARVVDQPDVP